MELLRGLGRRWYILLIGLVATGAGGYFIYQHVAPTYQASATHVLLPPDEQVSKSGGNPYLLLGGLTQALTILSTKLSSADMQESLTGGEPGTSFAVTANTSSGAAFLVVDTEAPTEDAALGLLEKVGSAATLTLSSMQSELGVSDAASIGLSTVVEDQSATADTSRRFQLLVGAVGVGIVVTIIIAAGVDGLLITRRRKRERLDSNAHGSGTADDGVDDSGDNELITSVADDVTESERVTERKGTANPSASRRRAARRARSTRESPMTTPDGSPSDDESADSDQSAAHDDSATREDDYSATREDTATASASPGHANNP